MSISFAAKYFALIPLMGVSFISDINATSYCKLPENTQTTIVKIDDVQSTIGNEHGVVRNRNEIKNLYNLLYCTETLEVPFNMNIMSTTLTFDDNETVSSN